MNDVPFPSNFVPIFIKLSLRKIISFFRPDNPQLQEAFDTVYEVKIREKYQPQVIEIFLGVAVKKYTGKPSVLELPAALDGF